MGKEKSKLRLKVNFRKMIPNITDEELETCRNTSNKTKTINKIKTE